MVRVSEATQKAARSVLLLLADKPAPVIAIEDSGEISLEWYLDNQHVAVVTVDDTYIRWAAMLGHNHPETGAEIFRNVIPARALVAIDAAI